MYSPPSTISGMMVLDAAISGITAGTSFFFLGNEMVCAFHSWCQALFHSICPIKNQHLRLWGMSLINISLIPQGCILPRRDKCTHGVLKTGRKPREGILCQLPCLILRVRAMREAQPKGSSCHTCDSSPSTHPHRTCIRANYVIWVWLDVNPWWTASRMEWFPPVETIWFPVHVYK